MSNDDGTPLHPTGLDMLQMIAEIASLKAMRERASTLYSLPGGSTYVDLMRAAGAFVIFGEPINDETGKNIVKEHADNVRRARMYVSMPAAVTKDGAVEWLNYFLEQK